MKNLTPGKIALLVVAAGAALMLVLSLILFFWIRDVRNELVRKENNVTAVYQQSQAILDEYVGGFYDKFGVANRKSEELNKILSNALTARYQGDNTSAQPFDAGERQALISAIVEAYPEVGNLDSYDAIIQHIEDGRAKFVNQQQRMIDVVRDYKTWIDLGLVRPLVIKGLLNAPTHRIEAAKGEKILNGQAALDHMSVVIQSSKTRDAFESGTLEPLMMPSEEADVEPTAATPPAQDSTTGTMPPVSEGDSPATGSPADLAAK